MKILIPVDVALNLPTLVPHNIDMRCRPHCGVGGLRCEVHCKLRLLFSLLHVHRKNFQMLNLVSVRRNAEANVRCMPCVENHLLQPVLAAV